MLNCIQACKALSPYTAYAAQKLKPTTLVAVACFLIAYVAMRVKKIFDFNFELDGLLQGSPPQTGAQPNPIDVNIPTNMPKDGFELFPFFPMDAQVKETIPLSDGTKVVVNDDGNCFFYALRYCLHTINHSDKNHSPSELRWTTRNFLEENLREGAPCKERVESYIRQELFEIATKRGEDIEQSLTSREVQLKDSGVSGEQIEKIITLERNAAKYFQDSALAISWPQQETTEQKAMVKSMIQDFVQIIGEEGFFVGASALFAISHQLNINIHVHCDDPTASNLQSFEVDGATQTIHLLQGANHYNAFIPKPPPQT